MSSNLRNKLEQLKGSLRLYTTGYMGHIAPAGMYFTVPTLQVIRKLEDLAEDYEDCTIELLQEAHSILTNPSSLVSEIQAAGETIAYLNNAHNFAASLGALYSAVRTAYRNGVAYVQISAVLYDLLYHLNRYQQPEATEGLMGWYNDHICKRINDNAELYDRAIAEANKRIQAARAYSGIPIDASGGAN